LTTRLLGSLAALLGLLAFAPTASAKHIQCGDVITESVKLDSDVACPADFEGSALVIGADHITVDLHGFSVLGSADDDHYAIVTDRPHRNVTLRDGRVAGVSWEAHPLSVELSDSVLRDLDTEGLGGFYVFGDLNVIRDNHVFASFSGMGIRGDFNRVVDNEVRAVEGYGIGASGRGFALDRNSVTLSETYGFHDAIAVWGFQDIQIRRNVVSAFDSDGIEIGGGNGALIDRNTAVHNANGILVGEQASEIILSRNLANDNYSSYAESGTGIRVNSASTVIERNTANDNFDYGIWAVPGVVDGGGNRASGNGTADCVNVICR
jgi:hypothetical protein